MHPIDQDGRILTDPAGSCNCCHSDGEMVYLSTRTPQMRRKDKQWTGVEITAFPRLYNLLFLEIRCMIVKRQLYFITADSILGNI